MFKNKKTKKIVILTTSIFLLLVSIFTAIYIFYIKPTNSKSELEVSTNPNIILMIGDGMGTEHLKLIKIYEGKLEEGYIFETCPNTLVTTNSATKGSSTDSAAAATAIATGHKVYNGVLSIQDPGDGSDLETILEILKSKKYSTGLITTTQIDHATPAAFASHTDSRNNTDEILKDYFTIKPDIIFGGLDKKYMDYITPEYSVAKNKEQLLSLKSTPDLGVFGDGGHIPYVNDRGDKTPSLLDTTQKALSLLNQNENGFFLMIEGGRIDHASHNNDTQKAIYELEEFINVINYVYGWAIGDQNTIVIVTADHETGGLEVLTEDPNSIPEVSWSTTGHTNSRVPLFICFDEEINISNITDNTDIFKYMNSIE